MLPLRAVHDFISGTLDGDAVDEEIQVCHIFVPEVLAAGLVAVQGPGVIQGTVSRDCKSSKDITNIDLRILLIKQISVFQFP